MSSAFITERNFLWSHIKVVSYKNTSFSTRFTLPLIIWTSSFTWRFEFSLYHSIVCS